MSAPICPRLAPTIHNESHNSDHGVWDRQSPEHERCKGSDCALWVPIMQRRGVDTMSDIASHLHRGIDEPPATHEELWNEAPRGLCADNLRREPWDDPAAKP